MTDRRLSDRIAEALQNADLRPDEPRKESVRAVIFEKAAFLKDLLDGGACSIKVASVFAREFGREVKAATIQTYLREALKGQGRPAGGVRGGAPKPRPKGPSPLPPQRPARLSAAPSAEMLPAATEGVLRLDDALIQQRGLTPSSLPDLPEYDETVSQPSATPSAPR